MTASDGFVGNILTTAQTAITRVGTLVNLSVTGNTTAGNLTTAGTLRASNVEGTVITAAQPNITTLGNLTNLEIAGNLIVFGNVSTIQAANVGFGKVFTSNLTALTLVSDDIRGHRHSAQHCQRGHTQWSKCKWTGQSRYCGQQQQRDRGNTVG